MIQLLFFCSFFWFAPQKVSQMQIKQQQPNTILIISKLQTYNISKEFTLFRMHCKVRYCLELAMQLKVFKTCVGKVFLVKTIGCVLLADWFRWNVFKVFLRHTHNTVALFNLFFFFFTEKQCTSWVFVSK